MNNTDLDRSEENKSFSRTILIPVSLFALFVIVYTTLAIMGPSRKIALINSEYGYKASGNTETDTQILSDSLFLALNIDRAWYQSRITMAESDSISLSLNLPDSAAFLEINGVTVFTAKLSSIKVSKVFTRADQYAVGSLFSFPLEIRSDISSIKREPLMHKIAPRDTSEYKPDAVPDTAKVEPVSYILEMGNGCRLYVYQESDGEGSAVNRLLFDLTDRTRNSWDIVKSVFTLKVPEYHPYIKIVLPGSDARIIYRALPKHGQVAVRI